MNDTASSSVPHRHIAWPAWALLSFIYFVSVEALHLYGYWSRFGVNLLGYAAVTDLAALLIYPSAGSLLACLAGLAIGQLLGNHAASPLDDTHEPAMSWMVDTILLALWWTLVGLILYFAPPVKWWGVLILIALPLARAAGPAGSAAAHAGRPHPHGHADAALRAAVLRLRGGHALGAPRAVRNQIHRRRNSSGFGRRPVGQDERSHAL